MPFIDMGNEFGDTKEAKVAPEGEYDLLCKEVEHETERGKNNIRVQISIEDEEEYAPVFHYLALPQPDKDAENDEKKGHAPGTTRRTKMLMIKRFLNAFNVPFTDTGFDPNDIRGARARLPLRQEVYEGRRSNRLVLPPLPEEGAGPVVQSGERRRRRAS